MTIQEALEIVADRTRKYWGLQGSNPHSEISEALAIVEIMLAEPAFITSYQEQTVETELQIQAEEAQ